MRKISAILPVYNEEALIKPCLEHLAPVDEIIVVDGGPLGPSNDKTPEIAKSFDNVKYIPGTYKTMPGAFDAGAQKNQGIAEATGDVFLFLSADMFFYNLDFLCDTIRKEEDIKVFFCITIEFWLDAYHVRMYANVGDLSLPSSPQQAVAIAREAQPISGEHGTIEAMSIKTKEQALVANTVKYHLGWIRPFQSQVDKHVQHVKQGRWGEDGERLLKGSEQRLDQWAILHVSSYNTIPNVGLKCVLPDEWKFMETMSYLDGQPASIKAFEKKHGTSPFKGVKK